MLFGILTLLGLFSLLALLVGLVVAFLAPQRWNKRAWPAVAVLSVINAVVAVAFVCLYGC
jgi:hypothetical protein